MGPSTQSKPTNIILIKILPLLSSTSGSNGTIPPTSSTQNRRRLGRLRRLFKPSSSKTSLHNRFFPELLGFHLHLLLSHKTRIVSGRSDNGFGFLGSGLLVFVGLVELQLIT